MNVFTQLTDSEGDAGEGGGRVDGAAEQRLDVVSLGGVLAPAQVRAGLQNRFCVQYTCTLTTISDPLCPLSYLGDSLVQAARQVVSAVRHAAHDVREVRLTLRGVCA